MFGYYIRITKENKKYISWLIHEARNEKDKSRLKWIKKCIRETQKVEGLETC